MEKGLEEFVQRMPVKISPFAKMSKSELLYTTQNLGESDLHVLFEDMMSVHKYGRVKRVAAKWWENASTALTDNILFVSTAAVAVATGRFMHYPEPLFYSGVAIAASAVGMGRGVLMGRNARRAERRTLDRKLEILQAQASPDYQKAAARAEALSMYANAEKQPYEAEQTAQTAVAETKALVSTAQP